MKRMNNKRGTLVLFTGSSGVGKGTVMGELYKLSDKIKLSVSNTTRPPRKGEIDGVHYNFVTTEQFKKLIEEDGYLEYAGYCGKYYGTPKRQVEELLDAGYDVFLEIEVKGGLQIMEKYPEVLSIFLLPPSMEELETRLRGRGTESEDVIQERLRQASEEIKYKNHYKYRVINDDAQRAAAEVFDILNNYKDSKEN